jgi:hypothetical protein
VEGFAWTFPREIALGHVLVLDGQSFNPSSWNYCIDIKNSASNIESVSEYFQTSHAWQRRWNTRAEDLRGWRDLILPAQRHSYDVWNSGFA